MNIIIFFFPLTRLIAEIQNEVPPFDTYISELFNVLNYLKISSNNQQSFLKKLCSTCLTTIMLIPLCLLCTAELINFKEISNLPTLTEHVNPVLFHAVGLFKWIYCIWKIDQLEELVETLRTCHKLSSSINENDKGKM